MRDETAKNYSSSHRWAAPEHKHYTTKIPSPGKLCFIEKVSPELVVNPFPYVAVSFSNTICRVQYYYESRQVSTFLPVDDGVVAPLEYGSILLWRYLLLPCDLEAIFRGARRWG